MINWIPIETLVESERKDGLKVLVCDASNESTTGYNFTQVVMWRDGKWVLTWDHQEYTKKITHYARLNLTNGKNIKCG